MKTLIAYATKRGFTKKCAELLSEKLEGTVEIADIKKSKNMDISSYENIIIGGSVYIGKIRKEVPDFYDRNMDKLLNKNIGLFICGLAEGEVVKKELEACFPDKLSERALVIDIFGGEYNFDKMNFIEKTVIKKIANTTENQEVLHLDRIEKFAEVFNSLQKKD
ncbi:MAG: flavodoxin domain-containing protein [Bacillota bacterium]|nr:flavodoxin domain-containing protein [Bacillota bacterium]